MSDFIGQMISRLPPEDRIELKSIFAPRVVAVPPNYAYRDLCVMPDGEIRHYGYGRKAHHNDISDPVYIASNDCGLSWKTFRVKDPNSLGSGLRLSDGTYVATYDRDGMPGNENKILAFAVSPDEKPYKQVKWLKEVPFTVSSWIRPGIELKVSKPGRLLFCVDGIIDPGAPERIQYFPCFCYSDDRGDTWSYTAATPAPMFEVVPPHKGPRWENGSVETTMIELADGTVYALSRTSHDYFYEYYSYDGGETWTDPKPSPFHATLTMPTLFKLSDGRILLFWCNTHPMSELDHEQQRPALNADAKNGRWEDVFTNRDANHAAISDDNGKTWRGFREIHLNDIRNFADFRSYGGAEQLLDKSVHQFQAIELPFGKVMLAFGQHPSSARLAIFDPDWLYETERSEDFRKGIGNLSTQMYVKSNYGGFAGFSGHCAYNRTNGALLVPDPDGDFTEVLQICRVHDERLEYERQGAVWNFSASLTGKVKVKLRVLGSGIRVSLAEMWINPADEYVGDYAHICFDVTSDYAKDPDTWYELTIRWDIKEKTALVQMDGNDIYRAAIEKPCPNGLCYLHLQTLAEHEDFKGTLIKTLTKTV